MQDVNKKKRTSLWIAFAISIISIPLFYFFDKKPIIESDLSTVDNLILSSDADYTSGKNASINIHLTNTKRTLVVNLEALSCVDKDDLLANLTEGDKISIRIPTSDITEFYETGIISKFQKIYGIREGDKEYIDLKCRNSVSANKARAGIYASSTSAILSLLFLTVFFKHKSKDENKQLKMDPMLIIGICWLLVMILFR